MKNLEPAYALLKDSVHAMSTDRTPMMGAALAYYMMFSIAPLLIVAIGLAGWVFGERAGSAVFDMIREIVGAEAATAVHSMVQAASSRPRTGALATVVGAATMLLGASGVFVQLQQSLNLIWKVTSGPEPGWGHFVRRRLLSFGMILVVGLIMLVSLIASAALAAAGDWLAGAMPGGRAPWLVLNFAVSVSLIGALFAALFKILPDVRLSWRDVQLGGLVTALLFSAGKAAIGAYLGRAGIASSYGAAGALVVVMLWVYYSSQILFFGAEFTRVYATRGGRIIPPKNGATLAG